MLKVLRKKGVSKMILWFLAVIIILAFGVFGTAYRMESKAEKKQKWAGKIFGRKFLYTEFRNQYEQMIIVDKLKFGNNFNKYRRQLEQDRVQRTWTRILFLEEAKKRNIQVSDNEVVEFIEHYPAFQVSEKFSDLLYRDILRNFLGVAPRTFEECVRDKLKMDKIVNQESALISVSDEEVKDAYRQYNEKVQVSYVFFANESYAKDVMTDENKVRAYYEGHKEDFTIPPMINVAYLRFDFPPPSGKVEKGKAPEIKDADKDAAWQKAYQAHKDLIDTPDLNAVAAKNGLKVEESGFFSMDQPNLKAGWPFELIEKIFAMKKGDISDPVQTPSGYQILQVKETKDASMPDFEAIRDKVTEVWKNLEAAKIARSRAEEALTKILALNLNPANIDTISAGKTISAEFVQTPTFGRVDSYLPKLGQSPEFMDQAFGLTKDKPWSQIAKTSKGYCLIHLDNRIEPDMKDFEKDKSKYENALLFDKREKAVNDFMTRLRLKSNLESLVADNQIVL